MARKKTGPNAQNTTIEHLLASKDKIYKWLCVGKTMTDIAKKLGVSRSWLFEMFAKHPVLDELRNSARAERYEHIHNTLYQLAIGNYKAYNKHTTKTTTTDNEGTVSTNTVVEENTHEHVADPNLRAMAIYMRTEHIMPKVDEGKIQDSITPDDFEYVDVADETSASDEDSSNEGH